MSSSNSYHFFASQNLAYGPAAVEEVKEFLGDDAGLIVVPYFKLPSYDEYFDDTEGRIPQLEQLERFLRDMNDAASEYWFAQVLPEKEDGRIEYLAVVNMGSLRLVRRFPTRSSRYIGTLVLPIGTH
jgi:hypothetical protein